MTTGISKFIETKAVPIAGLRAHPLNAQIYRPTTKAQDFELKESLRVYGQRSSIILCGKGSASPEGTILAGHRRVLAAAELGWTKLDAKIMHGLTGVEVELELRQDNVVGQAHRPLNQREKFENEERIRELSGRKQGARNDLDPTKPAGSTDTILGASLGTRPNAIKARRKIFKSKALVPELEAALDDGTVTVTEATLWIGEVEQVISAGQVSVKQAHDEMRMRVQLKRETVKARGGPGRRGKRSRKPMPLVPANSTHPPLGASEPAASTAAEGTRDHALSVRVTKAPLPKDRAGRVAAIDVAASNYRAAMMNVLSLANDLVLRVAPLTSSKDLVRTLAAMSAGTSLMGQVVRVLLPLDVDKARAVLLELASLEPAP